MSIWWRYVTRSNAYRAPSVAPVVRLPLASFADWTPFEDGSESGVVGRRR